MSKEFSLPGISVLMPVFNYARFIGRAITSLQQQSFSTWELIIINDGSTDETESVINGFQSDDRIRLLTNSENGGIGACLTRGLDESHYSTIAYLPSDDVYYKVHLQSLWDKLCANQKSVLCYSGMRHRCRVASLLQA